MIILTLYRAVLAETAAVNSKAIGGFHLLRVDQEALRPNILLEMPESGSDYTHSGPVGLYDGHLRVTCRADTFQAAVQLGDAVRAALENWQGQRFGMTVQMTSHFNSAAGYDEGAKVYTSVQEFTAFFTGAT